MSFLSYLINGISLGSVYAIIAWVTPWYMELQKMLNFAHGDVIMVGGYAVLLATTNLGLPPIIGILAAVCFLYSARCNDRTCRIPSAQECAASPLAVLITAIGSQLPAAEYCASAVPEPIQNLLNLL